MDQILLSLGINITSNAVYDFLKLIFLENKALNENELKSKLSAYLNIQNSNIVADKIIEFLAKNGDIRIEGTSIYARDTILLSSSKDTSFIFGNNSSSTTKNTKINTGQGAFIHGQGGASIKQNEDGSISFFT
jgi:hypothetical protein